MYKSLLSTEELKALLSAEQASELAADADQLEAPLNIHPHPIEEYLERIQRLESDMQILLNRVNVLETQLREYEAAGAGMAGAKEHEGESSKAQSQLAEVVPAPQAPPAEPIILSRVEKYKQIPRKSLFG